MTEEQKTREALVEKVAAAKWERQRQHDIQENFEDTLGPWFLPNPGWVDLPEDKHEAHYLRLSCLEEARAVIAIVAEECARVAENKHPMPEAPIITDTIRHMAGLSIAADIRALGVVK